MALRAMLIDPQLHQNPNHLLAAGAALCRGTMSVASSGQSKSCWMRSDMRTSDRLIHCQFAIAYYTSA